MEQEEIFQQTGKRQLKVHRKNVSRAYHQYVCFPEIRLCGKWLKDMGFHCGKSVTVRHEKNKIVITIDNDTKTAD